MNKKKSIRDCFLVRLSFRQVFPQNRLNMISFSESVFLLKAKLMYKVSNNIAPEYLTDLFKMRDSNSNSNLNLRSVSNKKI